MASARSTVSIARTTPAQKPRGEHNNTFSRGFWRGGEEGDEAMSVLFRVSSQVRGKAASTDLVFCTPLSSMGAAERQSFHCGAVAPRAGPPAVFAPPARPRGGLRAPHL